MEQHGSAAIKENIKMTIRTKQTPFGYKAPPYKKNFVIFESGTPGTYTITVKKALFEITITGGGGGGSNGAGGSGATLRVQTILDAGTYNLTIGSGGNGAGAYVRNNNGSPGSASTISGTSLSITANGGAGRNGRRNGGGGGTVGTLSYTFRNQNTISLKSTNGADYGLSYLTGNYDGYGAGGQPQSSDTGAGYPGKSGYIKIQFIK